MCVCTTTTRRAPPRSFRIHVSQRVAVPCPRSRAKQHVLCGPTILRRLSKGPVQLALNGSVAARAQRCNSRVLRGGGGIFRRLLPRSEESSAAAGVVFTPSFLRGGGRICRRRPRRRTHQLQRRHRLGADSVATGLGKRRQRLSGALFASPEPAAGVPARFHQQRVAYGSMAQVGVPPLRLQLLLLLPCARIACCWLGPTTTCGLAEGF